MTQAPATPELVERLRSYYPPICQEAADALEAQQARIAELEGAYQREARLVRAVDFECDEHLFALASERAAKDQAQALADRYEKALRNLFTTAERVVLSIEQDESGRWLLDGDGERLAGDLLESVDATRQALSSQGRREGGQHSSSRSQPCGVGPSDLTDPQSQHSDGEGW